MSAFGHSQALPRFAAVALACVLALSSAGAQTTLTWDPAANGSMSGGDGTWDTTTANWWNGTADVPWANGGGTTGTTAILKGTAGTVTLDAGGVTVGIGDSTKSIVVQTSGYTLAGGPLTIDDTGVGVDRNYIRLNTSGAADTLAIDSNLIVKGPQIYVRMFEVDSISQTVTLNGNLTLDSSVTNKKRLQATGGGGNVVINGNISNGGGAGGYISLGLADTTESTLDLTGSNTFTGGVEVRRGTVYASSNTALGSGDVYFGSGVGKLLATAAVTIGNRFFLDDRNGQLAAVIGGATAEVSTFTGAIKQNNNSLVGQPLLVTAVAGGTVTFAGEIYDHATINTLAVKKVGDGVVKFTRAAGNNYGLGTEVNVGTLLVSNTTGSGTGQGAVTVNSAAASASTFTRTLGLPTVTAGSTSGLIAGQSVTGTGIQAGTYIARILDGTSLVLSNITTAPGSSSLSFGAASGTLGGTGLIAGAATVGSGATVAPGDLTTGTLTLNSTSLLAGSTLAVEIDGINADKLVSTGVLDVTGAHLTVSLLGGGFTPSGSYVIAQGAPLTGSFASVPAGYAVSYTATEATLTQTAGSDYDSWKGGFTFANPPVDSLPTADPDGDGLTNQQEYAFGLNPTLGSSVNPVTAPLDKTTGIFTYTRRKLSLVAPMAYTVKTSTDLTGWSAASISGEVVTESGDIETVVVTLSGAPLGAPKLFVRVSAE